MELTWLQSYLGVIQIVFNVIFTLIMAYLTFIILKFTAKSRVKIRFENGKKEVDVSTGETLTLKFHLENQGYWFVKPAIKKLALFVNFLPIFEPIEIRYGSTLKRSNREVKIGKGGRKYLKTEEIIFLYNEEPGEDVVVDVKMPEKEEGRFPIEIPYYSQDGTYGFQKLWIKVKKTSPNSQNQRTWTCRNTVEYIKTSMKIAERIKNRSHILRKLSSKIQSLRRQKKEKL